MKTEKDSHFQKELLKYIVLLSIVILVRVFVLINAVIPTESMENTISAGSRVMGVKCAYMMEEPQRGDIIVFDAGNVDPGKLYIKRIIAIPGDIIEVKDGKTILNGEILEEDYLNEQNWDGKNVPAEEVPENCCFVMGDNRNNSLDARYWGEENRWVSYDAVIGKACFTYWPLDRLSWLK